jgi:hypothetical protein
MDSKNFYELVERMAQDEMETIATKGDEYTGGSSDMLNNFKGAATSIGLTPLQIWATFANKHWQSIMSYVRSGTEASEESIEGRIKDLRNYLTFLRALVEENKTTKPQASKPVVSSKKEDSVF